MPIASVVMGHFRKKNKNMTETEKIITLARRYCTENYTLWANKYSMGKSGNNNPYSDNDYNIFPRYNAIDAILKGVETIVGKSFIDIENCKSELKAIGQNCQTLFTTGKLNEISKKAIQEERKKFNDFIDIITDEQLETVEPLPYRRRLLESEANEVRKKLLKNWNFDGGYWEPLTPCCIKPFIFFNKENLSEHDFKIIKDIILCFQDNTIYEISEQRYDYEIAKSEIDIDCYETIYTNKNFEWIIYGSHEGTIAFGGEWLLAQLDKKLGDKRELKNKW
jgi:hypothetical protein